MAKRRSQARKQKSPLGSFLKGTFWVVVIGIALGGGYLGASLWTQMQDLPDITMLERYEPIEAIQIYDRFDHLVATVEGDEDRSVIPLNQVSTQMQQAMLAAEDHHFFEHKGINFLSIMRAMRNNLQAGQVVEGGSTITQQLVKNLFFTQSGRTYERKLKEAYLAFRLESQYSKERILEMYLNQIYFGNNAYGIERAAKRYFDKRAAELTLPEAAFIAGLVKAPSELGVVANRKRAFDRQNEILNKMVEYGYITENQSEEAKKTKLSFKKGRNPLQKYPYYMSYVLELLRDRFSQAELRRQGLRVYTNLDPAAQELAERILEERIKKAPKGVEQAALVSVLVQDGSVISLVGGVGNFWTHQFNRATHPHTAGSSFKPFVYLTAFRRGILNPDSIIEDTPLIVKQRWGLPDYKPQNFDHKFMGKITARKALMMSRNIPSVKIAQQIGSMDSIIETARLAGITTKLDPNLSLALGSSAVSPLDLAGAYATFARAGVQISPQVLRKIENSRGQIIEVFESKVDRVFDVEPVARLVSILQDVVNKGTGTAARLADRPVAGKTGTADEGRDTWFCGFTPDLVTVLWAGNDENKPISGKNVTGGVIMAPAWKQYTEEYYKLRPHVAGAFINPTPSNGEQLATTASPGGEQTQADPNATPPSAPELAPKSTEKVEKDPLLDDSSNQTISTTSTTIPTAPAPEKSHPVDPLLYPTGGGSTTGITEVKTESKKEDSASSHNQELLDN